MSTCQAKRQRNRDCKGHVTLFTSKISKVGPCLQQNPILICPVLVTSLKKLFYQLAKPALLSVQTTGQRRHHLPKSQQLVLKHDLMCKHLGLSDSFLWGWFVVFSISLNSVKPALYWEMQHSYTWTVAKVHLKASLLIHFTSINHEAFWSLDTRMT